MDYNEFKQETLDIFTIATGEYINFFSGFIKSVGNLFPENKKRIYVISDKESDYVYSGCIDSNVDQIKTIYTMDLPYPLILALKTAFLKKYIPEDSKYVFYVDIDTIFLKMSDTVCEFISNKIDNNYIIISKHPHYDSTEYGLTRSLRERNMESAAYISDEQYDEYVISSFWCCKTEHALTLCDIVNNKLRRDLLLFPSRYIPWFADENYINNIIWLTKTGKNTDIKFYDSEHLVTLPDKLFTVPAPYVFLLQKYRNEWKNSKKFE